MSWTFSALFFSWACPTLFPCLSSSHHSDPTVTASFFHNPALILALHISRVFSSQDHKSYLWNHESIVSCITDQCPVRCLHGMSAFLNLASVRFQFLLSQLCYLHVYSRGPLNQIRRRYWVTVQRTQRTFIMQQSSSTIPAFRHKSPRTFCHNILHAGFFETWAGKTKLHFFSSWLSFVLLLHFMAVLPVPFHYFHSRRQHCCCWFKRQ